MLSVSFSRLAGFLVSVSSFLMVGCSASGPKFSALPIAPDRGVVYIYRPGSIVGGAVKGGVEVNGKNIGSISSGGYLTAVCPPGSTKVSAETEAKNEISVDVKPGQANYVRTSIQIGVLVGRLKLEEVPAETGLKEIQDCSWINADPAPPAK